MTEQPARPTRRKRPAPFTVATAAIATFLVVLTLLVAQLQAGRDPALGRGTPVAALTQGKHGSKVVTRASGGASAVQPAGGAAAPAGPITTHTSGAGEYEDD